MSLTFAARGAEAWPLYVLEPDDVAVWVAQQSDETRHWVEASNFNGAIGSVLMIPGGGGMPTAALIGYGTAAQRARHRFVLAAGVPQLAPGTYRIEQGLEDAQTECLGWLLSGYGFSRYKDNTPRTAHLVAPASVDASRVEVLAAAEALTRDLVNTPASDMGPVALEAAARKLAAEFQAFVQVTTGEDLLKQNFPMIHAVGRAAAEAPRLIDMRWGTDGPAVTLVGKGVCFDTGGLNLKPGSSMGLMKKDMGGSANVLGLAQMIMALDLPVRLRVLIPAVENSVSSNSFRPQDILTSRKGLTVEINNTDAEGRLVLGDTIHYVCEHYEPDTLMNIATLTGAVRTALGLFVTGMITDATNDEIDAEFADEVTRLGHKSGEWVWRLPVDDAYLVQLSSKVADITNCNVDGKSGAGTITAALFVKQFVDFSKVRRWAHFDIAATAFMERSLIYNRVTYWPKEGATGVGVRLMTEIAQHMCSEQRKSE